MQILITNIYSHKNKGDATIVISAINGLINKHNTNDITLSTDDLADEGKYGNYKVIPSFTRLYNNKLKSDFLNNILNLFLYFRLSVIYYIEQFLFNHSLRLNLFYGKTLKDKLRAYREADIVYAIGGGYLLTKTSLRKTDRILGRASLHITCLEFCFAKAYKKPLILLHQSIGPFNNCSDTKQVMHYLKCADLIISREHYSHELLVQNGIKNALIKPDLAFSFAIPGKSYFKTPGIRNFNCRIGITARLCLNEKEQKRYEKELTVFINYFLKKDLSSAVYFLPQVVYSGRGDDDTVVARRICNSVDKEHRERCFSIENDFSPQDLRETISDCDYFIGTRMHSNIFALTSYVKTIAIAYEYKTTGIMEMLGLEKFCTKAENLKSDFLIKSLQSLDEDINYRINLKNRIEQMKNNTWDFNFPNNL